MTTGEASRLVAQGTDEIDRTAVTHARAVDGESPADAGDLHVDDTSSHRRRGRGVVLLTAVAAVAVAGTTLARRGNQVARTGGGGGASEELWAADAGASSSELRRAAPFVVASAPELEELNAETPPLPPFSVDFVNVTFLETSKLCALLTLQLVPGNEGTDMAPLSIAANYGHENENVDNPMFLWSALSPVPDDGLATITMCRLRFDSHFVADVYYQYGQNGIRKLVTEINFHTGVSEHFTAGKYVDVTGSPSWTLQTAYSAVESSRGNWTGLITVDNEGYIVWYHEMYFSGHKDDSTGVTGYGVFDRIPGSYQTVVLRTVQNYQDLDPVLESDLYEVSPLGVITHKLENTCEGNALENFNGYNHEARVDTLDKPHYNVWTLMYKVSHAYGTAASSGLSTWGSNAAGLWTAEYGDEANVSFVGAEIVSWDRSVRNGDPHVLYDLFDIVNPHNAVPLGETVNPSVTTMDLKCTGGEHYLGIDYHHASSVNQGMTNNILVALRNLNTIISLDRQGTGVQWILSSSWDSDFSFASEGDKFYNPHDVWQFSHNTITFIDDGNNRPDCTWDDDAMEGCYSRAVELALDFETMQATVVWQFEYPNLAWGPGGEHVAEEEDVFNLDGGSINVIPSDVSTYARGNMLVSFSALMASDKTTDAGRLAYKARSIAYEANVHGHAISLAKWPIDPYYDSAGRYRIDVTATVSGESKTSPFIS